MSLFNFKADAAGATYYAGSIVSENNWTGTAPINSSNALGAPDNSWAVLDDGVEVPFGEDNPDWDWGESFTVSGFGVSSTDHFISASLGMRVRKTGNDGNDDLRVILGNDPNNFSNQVAEFTPVQGPTYEDRLISLPGITSWAELSSISIVNKYDRDIPNAIGYESIQIDAIWISVQYVATPATPVNQGWNLASKSSAPNESPPDLACNISGTVYTNENSVAHNWSAVSGDNIVYQREVTYPNGTVGTNFYATNNYTPFSSFGGHPGTKGLWRTRVRAFEDMNGNNTFEDGVDYASAWSNYCNITLDQTPPFVEVTSHDDGNIVSGAIDIYGTVTDNNPHHYWAVVNNSGGTKVAGPGTVNRLNSFTNEKLFSWDTTTVPDGVYTIKLEARDSAGNKKPDLAPILVDPEDLTDSVDWAEVTVSNPSQEPVSLTVCKWDDTNGNGEWDGQETAIPGWEVVVHPNTNPVWTGMLDSADYIGLNTLTLLSGHKYLVEVESTWNNNSRVVDAEYYSDNNWGSYGNLEDDPSRDVRQLDVVIDDANVDWGSYNGSHLYKTVIEGQDSSANIRVFDQDGAAPPAWYGDNVGSLSLRIYDISNEIYVTGQNGCVTVDTIEGDYQILEVSQDGWTQTYPQNPDYHHVSVNQSMYWAGSVENFIPGLRKDGSAVLAARSNPDTALGIPDATTNPDTGFVSLGFGGSLSLEFAFPIADVDGEDLSFYEVTNGRKSYPQEKAMIEVSQNGTDWLSAGEITNDNAVEYLDFGSTGLAWIKYVRITDTTDSSIHSSNADGYDLDAVDASSIWTSFGNMEEERVSGSIIGRKYYDTNMNSIHDNTTDEPRLDSWMIRLYSENWQQLDTKITGQSVIGQYRFDSLDSGTYYVCEVLQEGWMQTAPTLGQHNSTQSTNPGHYQGDAYGVVNGSGSNDEGSMCWQMDINENNEIVDNVKFGNVEHGKVSGFKYEDLNANGNREMEPGLGGWDIVLGNYRRIRTVEVYPNLAVPANLGMFENGEYYVVRVSGTFGAGDMITADAECSTRNGSPWDTYVENYEEYGERLLDLELDSQPTDWGMCNPNNSYTKVIIGDGSTHSALINDIYRPNNTGNLTVAIYHLSNVIMDTTDGSGYFEFENVMPGRYALCEIQQPGWTQTEPLRPNSGGCYTLNVVGNFDREYDFGNYNYGLIQGRKYLDEDMSGDHESGEEWLNDWEITLYNSDWKEIDKMMTGDDTTPAGNVANGQYRFVNLLPGTYYTCEEDRTSDGWVQTEPDSGFMHDGLYCHRARITASGQLRAGRQFGNFRNSVTLCKEDSYYGNPLENWDLMLSPMDKPVETIDVESDGNVYSSSDLPAGYYAVKVGGTYRFGNWGQYGIADAEWAYRNDAYTDDPLASHGWTVGELTYPSVVGLDLQVNHTNINWGAFNPDHFYYHTFYHSGGSINFNIHDSNYSDNEGFLTAEIYETTFSGTTGENGCTTFDEVSYGDYIIGEELQENWENISGLGEVTINEPDMEFTVVNEYQLGDLKVCKFEDTNGNGIRDMKAGEDKSVEVFIEPEYSEDYIAWGVHVTGLEDVEQGEDECYTWENIQIGDYEVYEDEIAGLEWILTAVWVNGVNVGAANNVLVTVEPMQKTLVEFGNYPNPALYIEKTNNRLGEDIYAGDNVSYMITVTARYNTVYGVEVTDLLPEGFEYRNGSWKAFLTQRIDGEEFKSEISIPEPVYNSPGVWEIGTMEAGGK
ncbi:hypothetical protein KJ918_02325, partial [Patescibacteria group bacterium]|nr:hypothetical protein [Patescibacteria group bacterium]